MLDGYAYEYDKTQMITGITRNAKAMQFFYDRTYQLTDKRGNYANASLAGAGKAVTKRLCLARV